ncbi:MAG: hypothetical protein Q8K92_24045 [Leadbetterella sp.]|nr:hypothetical protein [Leadbetterella sp.]
MFTPNSHQLKIIADFANYIAVAWFTGGIVTPILTQPDSLIHHINIPIGSTVMTLIFLWLSLTVAKRAIA